MVRLHIFPIFLFLAKMLSFLCRKDNIFARNENIGKICKRTITWTDFISLVFSKMITKQQKVFSKSNLTLTRSEIWTLWLSRGYWIALIKVPVTFLVFGHFLKVRRYRLVLKRSKWKWLFIKKQGQQQTCTHLGMYYLSCDKWLLHWVSDGHLSALNSISYS